MKKQMIQRKVGILLVLLAVLLGTIFVRPDMVQTAGKVQLKTKKISLKVGQTQKIKLKKKKAKAKYTFKSSKKKVAKVNKSGVVTGKSAGTARVTVREILKKKSRKIGVVKITVKQTQPVVTPDGNKPTSSSGGKSPTVATNPSSGIDTSNGTNNGYLTFRRPEYLLEHYEKHGIEMGFSSPEEYLARANEVIKDPASLHKLEAEDGDDVYYLEATNDFVIVSTDGYIRTYFRPRDGIDYFNRQ